MKIDEFSLSIIYQNEDYVVVNKESGLSVHSGTNNQFGLIDIARAKFPLLEIDLCHRIDKSTSGCILLAKNKIHQVKFDYIVISPGINFNNCKLKNYLKKKKNIIVTEDDVVITNRYEYF